MHINGSFIVLELKQDTVCPIKQPTVLDLKHYVKIQLLPHEIV